MTSGPMSDREWMAHMERSHRRLQVVMLLGFAAFIGAICMGWI